MSRYRYGAYRDGPDPLSPPYDVRDALDAMGDAVLEGTRPDEALRDLLRRGLPGEGGRRGLDDLLRQVRERRRALRDRGQAGRHAGAGAGAARHRDRAGAGRAVPRPGRRRAAA